jgi:hypothetical protein
MFKFTNVSQTEKIFKLEFAAVEKISDTKAAGSLGNAIFVTW